MRLTQEQTIISVSGSGIVGFNYKLVTDQNSCDQASDYISVDSTSLTLDLSSVAEGSATLCALGSISSGFTKPADNGASSFSWIEDLSAPLYPISISGLEADTHQNTMTLTINDTDIEHYRYALSLNADSDCSDIGNYSSELDIGDGTLTLIYDLAGDYTLCMIASDYAGNWQSTENSSKEYFTFSVAAQKSQM